MVTENNDNSTTEPRVWVLTNAHAGNRIQAVALVEALGWSYEVKELHFTKWSRRRSFLPFLPLTLGLDRIKSSPLLPPWPDLVIGVGRSTAPITRWIGRASGGHSLTVQLGRGGGAVADKYDAVVTPIHCRMPPDPRRYDTIAPLHSISLQLLAEASSHWTGLLDALPRPVVVTLVGGNASRFRFSANDARLMALQVQEWAEEAGGSVVAVTSRRTGQAATWALQSVLTPPHRVYPWQPGPSANPYRALLAQADVLVVTGESESMLAEAAGTTAPLYIYPVTEIKSDRISSRFHEWGISRAHSYFSIKSSKGNTFDPVGFVFAWLMRKGLLRPRREMKTLHNALFACGRARPFGEPLVSAPQQPLPAEAPKVAGWLVKVLKLNQ